MNMLDAGESRKELKNMQKTQKKITKILHFKCVDNLRGRQQHWRKILFCECIDIFIESHCLI